MNSLSIGNKQQRLYSCKIEDFFKAVGTVKLQEKTIIRISASKGQLPIPQINKKKNNKM